MYASHQPLGSGSTEEKAARLKANSDRAKNNRCKPRGAKNPCAAIGLAKKKIMQSSSRH
jgi:hypothetical protein